MTRARLAFALLALLATPILTGANSDGCSGDVPIGNDDPGGASCGSNTCQQGEVCCNASCGICVAEGGACIQLACEPDEVPCGNSTCAAGEYCCNPECGICTTAGNACPAIGCEPEGVPCGENFCQNGEYCCNASCGTCAPEGSACDAIACVPGGVPCGDTTCGAGEECCNDSCSICVPEGGDCIQLECDGERTPVSGACVKNNGDACTSDADCQAGGCGGELCFNPAVSGGASDCDCTQPPYACGCVAGSCIWYE